MRKDPEGLLAEINSERARFLVVRGSETLVADSSLKLLSRDELSTAAEDFEPQRCTLLGSYESETVFAIPVAPEFSFEPATFAGLPELAAATSAAEAGLAAFAKAILSWQYAHRHCGKCGAMNSRGEAGFVMTCADDDCGHRSFPRLDPAIIVLVIDGDRALVGRQPVWPEKSFSTIAGFVEPGESLEEAVRREVREETNIRVGSVKYIASQPWPFPAALMIGFHAIAQSTEIALNDDELAEARWITREQIRSQEVLLPPKISVAYYLMQTWFDDYDGPALSELNLPNPIFRRVRPLDKKS